MPDDLSNRGTQDCAHINMSEPHEVAYWIRKWSVTEEQLRRAVKQAGNSAAAVASRLGKSPD